MKPIFHGKVDGGKLTLFDREQFANYCKTFEGKPVELTIEKAVNRRSKNQNRFYFGVVVKLLAECFGYTPDEMHQALKWEFLRVRGDGKKPDTVKRTRDLTTEEFGDYTERIMRWAVTTYGVIIPEPGEVLIED